MRIVKEPDERKQEILNAAIRVFARKGYDKTSISDIAKEIGISQGLCYRYFPSKEAMYDEAIEEYANYIADKNMSSYHYQNYSLNEQINLLSGNMKTYSSVEKDKKELYELFHHEGSKKMHDELFLQVAKCLIPFITNILEIANERGEISISNPEAMAYFFIYGQLGILMRNDISDDEKTEQIQNCAYKLFGL